MFPVRYRLGFYIPEDEILHSHRREKLRSYMVAFIYPVRTNFRKLESGLNGNSNNTNETRIQ
jgi:hypothetical protein